MVRRGLTIAVGLVLQGASLVAGGRLGTEPGQERQQRPPTLRSAVDVIAVDVQVIDRDGRPVTGLGPEKFTVTINGRRHRVLTAELVDSRTSSGSNRPPRDAATNAQTVAASGGRVIVLAVDCISFSPGVILRALETIRRFVERLPPEDLIGLVAYPIGPDIDPTTDRTAVVRALDSVVGQRDVAPLSPQFSLRPSEIIDISTEIPQEDGPLLTALARRECGVPVELVCLKRLSVEVTSAALYYESLANVSIGGLRSLLRRMGAMPGRKTLVLVSGGLISSDRPGGRPDFNDLGTEAGREAARAGTAVYTLRLDTAFQDLYAAEFRGTVKDPTDLGRDAELRGRWLEQFSGAAGGALFRVTDGSTDYAFNRILSETSSYYLLGVESTEADRGGRIHEMKVRVDYRNSTVRSRRWIAMGKKDGGEIAPATAAPPAVKAALPAPSAGSPPAPALAREVQPFADTFERGDYAGLQRQLAEAKDLANIIRALRTSAAPPWPEAPRRAAVFALEVAVAGLRSDNGFARDQASRLLAEYSTRVRHPGGADAFECTWLWTEVAALGGLFQPALTSGFVRRALLRCPAEPRFHLADAVITEQQWLSGLRSGEGETSDVVRRYETAMKFPETELEARVRCASFLFRLGQLDRAIGLLDGASGISSDTYVRYLADLVRGRVLHALGRTEEAIDAVRRALVASPGAQSARVLLMTMLVMRGDRQAAAELAEAVETSADDESDPWWTYWFGDFRAYPAIVVRLRELAR